MLSCENYKMFRGTATIVPKNPKFPPFEVTGDWLYKGEWKTWYCRGSSYPESIVQDIREQSDEDYFELMETAQAIDGLEITAENAKEVKRLVGKIMEQLVAMRG